eukprot:756254-Hanusia_phi.AAC.2
MTPGDVLIVPQTGTLTIRTEMGEIVVEQSEIFGGACVFCCRVTFSPPSYPQVRSVLSRAALSSGWRWRSKSGGTCWKAFRGTSAFLTWDRSDPTGWQTPEISRQIDSHWSA